jgi:hypothetical protein
MNARATHRCHVPPAEPGMGERASEPRLEARISVTDRHWPLGRIAGLERQQ